MLITITIRSEEGRGGTCGAWPGPTTALRSRAGAPEGGSGIWDLEAPWRVSVPSSCKGALKLARARTRGGAWASWVSKSPLIQGFFKSKSASENHLSLDDQIKCVIEFVRLDTDRSDALARE